MSRRKDELDELFPYSSRLDGSLMLIQALNELTFEARALEWFSKHAPLVVEELRRQGYKIVKTR